MQHREDYRGFRIDVDASAGAVCVRIFALEADGSLQPGGEPMNTQSYVPPQDTIDSSKELIDGALMLARSGIDKLVGPDDAWSIRPKHEIVDAARAGKPGRLPVLFVGADQNERLKEMSRVLDSTPLDGLRATILLNPDDFASQPMPGNRPDLAGIRAEAEVPAGTFHLLLEAAEAPRETGSS